MTIISLILSVLTLIAVVILILRKPSQANADLARDFENADKNLERAQRALQEEIARNRTELNDTIQKFREELQITLNSFNKAVISQMAEMATSNKNQLDTFSKQLTTMTQINEQKLEKVREVVDLRLKTLQEDNGQRLEKMRETVDEKLHSTLEKRLGESFKQVSDRLEKVHQGLGEMQTLASGVGDLKKILSNVKTRGTFGEGQLENLLSEILTPDKYEKNFSTKKGSRDVVEFAIKFPGNKNDETVYLPIDSKFPMEYFDKLQIAQEAANLPLVEEAGKALDARMKQEAKNIRDKYLDPPNTTEFGIMFLPTESLYAEALRRPGLSDFLRREYRVSIAGPTTIVALLNTFQMGFRTLAVEKRASDVWNLLGNVKKEFGNFASLLENTQTKLESAGKTLGEAASKSRNIERKLKNVQELPSGVQPLLIEESEADAVVE